MEFMLWMVGGLVVAVLIAVVVDRRRGSSGSRDHPGPKLPHRSDKGHDSFMWPTAGG